MHLKSVAIDQENIFYFEHRVSISTLFGCALFFKFVSFSCCTKQSKKA